MRGKGREGSTLLTLCRVHSLWEAQLALEGLGSVVFHFSLSDKSVPRFLELFSEIYSLVPLFYLSEYSETSPTLRAGAQLVALPPGNKPFSNTFHPALEMLVPTQSPKSKQSTWWPVGHIQSARS